MKNTQDIDGSQLAPVTGSETPAVGNLSPHDRQQMIYALFDELTTSSFAEGCEDRIARGLEARTDAQLLTLANEKGTWTPKWAESPNERRISGTPPNGELK